MTPWLSLAISADERTLFHCESFVGVSAYDLDAATGRLGPPRKLLDKADCDGIKLDGEGRLWITGFRSNEIAIVSPDGGQVGAYPVPAGAVTNLWFGGADERDIYFTAVEPVAVGAPDEVVSPSTLTSTLLRGRAPLAGQTVRRPKLRLG